MDLNAWQWLALAERELLLFAGIFFLLGTLDELAVDLTWLWLRVTRRAGSRPFADAIVPSARRVAVFIPAWEESDVLATTLRHMLAAWREADVQLWVGTYPNDHATAAIAAEAAYANPQIRHVVLPHDGPTTKADCLNHLYHALVAAERSECPVDYVLVHDAEDMVDHRALTVIGQARDAGADMVQLPVLPMPVTRSRWIAGHYIDEFCESHAKAMVVRDALGVALPSAGVGCAIGREWLDRLAASASSGDPFAPTSLTEDYELGLRLAAMGARSRFVRQRGADGLLVATRACFPASLGAAVRQKTRWMHGIAFQGWDRLGWHRRPAEIWWRLRDRRGPLTALTLSAAYLLLVLAAASWLARLAGGGVSVPLDPTIKLLLGVNLASLLWRAANRAAFTAREHGWNEGVRAVLRIPVSNIIAIMAGRRALNAYLAALAGRPARWDKTEHLDHPALAAP